MKKLLITLAVTAFTVSSASAASFWDEFTSIFKKHAENARNEVVETQTSKLQASTEASKASREAKITALEKKRDAEVKIIEDQIDAKEAQIKSIKNLDITDSQKKARISAIESQIKYLEKQKKNTEKLYDKQLKLLKGN